MLQGDDNFSSRVISWSTNGNATYGTGCLGQKTGFSVNVASVPIQCPRESSKMAVC